MSLHKLSFSRRSVSISESFQPCAEGHGGIIPGWWTARSVHRSVDGQSVCRSTAMAGILSPGLLVLVQNFCSLLPALLKVHNSLLCLLSIWTEVVVSAPQTCRNRSRLGLRWCAVVDQQREEEGTLCLRPPACKLCPISSLGSSSRCCVLEFKDCVLSVCQTPGGPHQQGPLVIWLTPVVAA